jgi:septal ring factor EnvC (AmiA/AmiB activator)
MTQQEEQDAAVKAAIGEVQTIVNMLTQRCASHAANIAVLGLKVKDLNTQVEDARKEIKDKHEARTAAGKPATQ